MTRCGCDCHNIDDGFKDMCCVACLTTKTRARPCPGIWPNLDEYMLPPEQRDQPMHCEGCPGCAPASASGGLTEEERELLRWGIFRMTIGGVPSYRDEPFEASFARDKKNMADWNALMARLTTPGDPDTVCRSDPWFIGAIAFALGFIVGWLSFALSMCRPGGCL